MGPSLLWETKTGKNSITRFFEKRPIELFNLYCVDLPVFAKYLNGLHPIPSESVYPTMSVNVMADCWCFATILVGYEDLQQIPLYFPIPVSW